MGEMMKNSNSPAMEKIEFMFSRIIAIFIDTPSYLSVIFSEEIFKNDRQLQDKVVEIMNQNEATVEHIIRSGQESGEIRDDIDVKNLALIVMGSLRFKIKLWDLKTAERDLMAEGNALINNLKKILEPIK
jgi:nucleotide-binding universal stress UspA family protein